ncbi:hypothetical protein [Rheinheimera sp. WS51]|uniref:hypothetical protein n=1 Tax=Rheinheimera sp. WS51 TaxID=3425886 RepID=UPI003D9440E8
MSTAAFAADFTVKITNKTGYIIAFMYVSPDKVKSWQEDVLQNEIMEHGETYEINLNGYNSPIFDIKLVDEEGDTYTFYDFNVKTYDLVVTIDNIDQD